MSANSGPGYAKNPAHRVQTVPAGVRVRVTVEGEVIADTKDAIRLQEASYASVFYVPRKDVNMSRLSLTAHHTYCPFKGHAVYFSVSVGDRVAENAVWSYEQPYDEVAVIGEYLAFYPNRVDGIEASPL